MRTRDEATLKALCLGKLPPGTPLEGLPRLRFDRVARRVMKSLQQSLVGVPAERAALVVTITAPIRMPGRTAGELGEYLSKPRLRNFDEVVCGNRVRARLVHCDVRGAPRVIVFVHNPDVAPTALFRLVEASLS